jgi:hypothetical protein
MRGPSQPPAPARAGLEGGEGDERADRGGAERDGGGELDEHVSTEEQEDSGEHRRGTTDRRRHPPLGDPDHVPRDDADRPGEASDAQRPQDADEATERRTPAATQQGTRPQREDGEERRERDTTPDGELRPVLGDEQPDRP